MKNRPRRWSWEVEPESDSVADALIIVAGALEAVTVAGHGAVDATSLRQGDDPFDTVTDSRLRRCADDHQRGNNSDAPHEHSP